MGAYSPAGAERFRLYSGGPANPAVENTGLASLTSPSVDSASVAKPWHPHSPLFAFGAVAALAFGLMAVSTSGSASVRLGKATATIVGGAGVGKK